MDEQKVKPYLTKLSEDKELQAKMQDAKTPEDALAAAKEAGFEFDAQEFKDLMIMLTVSVKQAKGEELTDEELDAVAGGMTPGQEAAAIGGAAAAGVACSASACV